jgi:hypothetical protein
MGRKSQGESSSNAATVGGVLGTILIIAVAIGIVVLKQQRRAARNQDNVQYNDNRGGGDFNPQPVQPFNPQPFNPAPQPEPKVLKPGLSQTTPEGGIFASVEYREYREDGAILIGFDVGLGEVPDTAVVTYLRPIWLTAKGEQYGTAYGRTQNQITTVKARDGYAVGGIRIKGGGAIEGLCFTFMRRGEKHLIQDDFYISDWYGEQTRKPPQEDLRRGDGHFAIGLYGKRYEDKGGFDFDKTGGIGTIGLYLWVKE